MPYQILEQNGDSRELAVLVHGYNSNALKLADIKKEIKAQLPNADILAPRYNTDFFKNTSPYEIASNIEVHIREADEDKSGGGKPYERIILVGYSSGALLTRKAYVYGWGSTEDHPIHKGETRKQEWVSRVERIILIAGMNRGWSLNNKPEQMSRLLFLILRLFLPLMRLLPVGKFLKGIERGSPFVADLRIQWIRLIHRHPKQIAPVLQLLGGKDELVTAEDDRDLKVHRDFVFIPVEGTNHTTLLQFNDPEVGPRSRKRFLEALLGPIATLKGKYGNPQIEPVEAHIVFIMHGIRDFGGWVGEVSKKLKDVARELKDSMPTMPEVIPVTAKYGYFPMGAFLLLKSRKKNVRWFMDEYTEQIAEYCHPNTKVSFIGHSNGTYLAASALHTYKTLKLHHVSFAGSVVPQEFGWKRIINGNNETRVEKLRNDLASGDWVVAIFPKLFDQMNWSDIGSGGFDGFNDAAANENEVRYFRGGHSAAITKENHESLAKFILTGETGNINPDLLTDSQPVWLQWASKLCAFLWLGIIALLLLIGFLFQNSFGNPVAFWVLYICLILFLLKVV